jgi:hypothetical protein
MTTIRRIFPRACVLFCLVTASNPASAAPIVYDESVSGEVDLTYSTSPFLLDIGVNRILGTTSYVDFDSFAFDIPAGLQLTQVDLLFRVIDDPDIDSALWTSFTIDDDQNQSGPGLAFEEFDFSVVSAPLTSLFAAVLPLGPGGFEMLGGSMTASEFWTLHYEWNLVVEPAATVPEPGTIALLGIGLPALLRYRKRQAALRRRE